MADKLDLDALQAVCDAATEGPFTAHEGVVYHGDWYHGVRKHQLCTINHSKEEAMFCSQDVRDGRWIATARTAMPQLIARIRELEAEAEEPVTCPTCAGCYP